MRRRISAMTFFIAISIGLSGCGGDEPSDQPTGAGDTGTTDTDLVIANGTAPSSFDPVASAAGRRLQYLWLVYDALIRIGPDGEPQPGLATSWTYSENNTVFDMTLREDVTFSDGTPFDAEAVKANLERARQTSGPQTSQLALVESVEVTGAHQVRINLSAPNPALPVIFSQNMGMMVSPPALAHPDELALSPAGAGPYELDTAATVPDDRYVFVANDDYYDPEAYPFEEVTIRVIEDRPAILQALQTGDLDGGEGNAEVAQAAEGAGLDVITQPTDSASVMLLDRAGEIVPALGDVRVRQALNLAVDRAAIVDAVLQGRGKPTSQFISPGQEGYDEELDDHYGYDPDRARDLLADAGFADGFDLPILTSPTSTPVVEAIAGFLGEVGVNVEIVPAGPDGIVTDMLTGTHAAAYLPWGMTDTYLDSDLLLQPDGAYNPLGSSDDEMLRLIEEGAAQDTEQREATYKQLSQRIVDEAWFLTVFIADAIYMSGDTVTDVAHTPHIVVPDIRGWKPTS